MDAKIELLENLTEHLTDVSHCHNLKDIETEIAFIINDLNRFRYSGTNEDIARIALINTIEYCGKRITNIEASKAEIIKLIQMEMEWALPMFTISISTRKQVQLKLSLNYLTPLGSPLMQHFYFLQESSG